MNPILCFRGGFVINTTDDDDGDCASDAGTERTAPSECARSIASSKSGAKLTVMNLLLHGKSASQLSPLEWLQVKDGLKAAYKTIETIAACRSGSRYLVGAAVSNMPVGGEARLTTSTQDLVDKYDKVAHGILLEQPPINIFA